MDQTLKAAHVGIKGRFKLEALKVQKDHRGNIVYDKNGNAIPLESTRRALTGWCPNILLTNGRNQLTSQTNWMNAVQVGTDNTVPTAGDTGLLGYVAGTTNKNVDNFGAQASAPYYGWRRITYRYPVGVTAGNLSEVGVGWSASAGATCMTRALIVDGLGVPTTVTPLSDEILDVTYEMRYYPPLVDVTGQVTLDGILYDYTVRAAQVTNSTIWGAYIGQAITKVADNEDWYATDGILGTLEQGPSGAASFCDNSSQYALSYVNNSYQLIVGTGCGPTGWNLGSGIRSIRILTTAGAFQTEFAAASGGATIPKTTLKTMQMQWVIAFSEGVIP